MLRSLLALLFLVTAVPGDLAGQDPAAERLLVAADRLASGGDAAAAVAELQLLVRQFPGDRQAPLALFRMAKLQRALGDPGAARTTLERLLSEHARSPEAARAVNLQGELALDAARSGQDLAAAQSLFQRVVLLFGREAYPDLEARREARIRSGELSWMLGDPASAAAELVAAIEDEAPSAAEGRTRIALARAWITAGNWQAAAAVLEAVAGAGDASSETSSRAEARRLLSLLHRRVLRPLSGQKPWASKGRYPPSGPDLREPSGVAAAPDGRLLVLDARLPLLVLLGGDGSETARLSLGDVERPGWLSSGQPFVVGAGGVTLPFDGTSRAFDDPRRAAPLKNLVAAQGGAFGDWFLAAKGSKSLLHVPDGRPSRELLAASRPAVADLARDRLGRVYVLDSRASQVVRVDRDGQSEGVVLAGEWKKAAALDVDDLGHLYVLDRGNRTLELFSPDGRLLDRAGPVLGGGIELRNPVDVAVDGAGRVFVADTKLPFVVMLD